MAITSSPASKLEAITPNDSTDLTAKKFRALFVGTGGNVQVLAVGDTSPVLLKGVANGQVIPVSVKRVYSTNTTAADIVGLG